MKGKLIWYVGSLTRQWRSGRGLCYRCTYMCPLLIFSKTLGKVSSLDPALKHHHVYCNLIHIQPLLIVGNLMGKKKSRPVLTNCYSGFQGLEFLLYTMISYPCTVLLRAKLLPEHCSLCIFLAFIDNLRQQFEAANYQAIQAC